MAKKQGDDVDEIVAKDAADIDESKGQFPKWVYGPKGAKKIVQNAAEQRKLGADWRETPSA